MLTPTFKVGNLVVMVVVVVVVVYTTTDYNLYYLSVEKKRSEEEVCGRGRSSGRQGRYKGEYKLLTFSISLLTYCQIKKLYLSLSTKSKDHNHMLELQSKL